MDQEERASADLNGFLAQVGDSSLWAGLIRDARRRIRQLERKSGAGGTGVAGARALDPRKIGGLVAGGSLGVSSVLTGLMAVATWEEALDIAGLLEGVEYSVVSAGQGDAFGEKLRLGEAAQTQSRVLSAVAVGTALGAIASFVIAATADTAPHAALPVPVLVPTEGGAAVLWEARW